MRMAAKTAIAKSRRQCLPIKARSNHPESGKNRLNTIMTRYAPRIPPMNRSTSAIKYLGAFQLIV